MAALRIVSLMNATLLAGASLALGFAAPVNDQSIGVVMTSVSGGNIYFDGRGTAGSANLIQGARVQTGDALYGTRATLAEASQARVSADPILLAKGPTDVSTKDHPVQSQEVRAATQSGKALTLTGKSHNAGGKANLNASSMAVAKASSSAWAEGHDGHGGEGDHGGGYGGGQGNHGGDNGGDHGGVQGNHGGDDGGDHGGVQGNHGGDDGGDHGGDHGGGHGGDHGGDHHHHHHHHPPVSRP